MKASRIRIASLVIFLIQIYLSGCGRYAGYKSVSDEARKTNPEYDKNKQKKRILHSSPSNLVISAYLDDTGSLLPNKRLDGEETARIIVTVRNDEANAGRAVGIGFGVVCGITSNNRDIRIEGNQKILGDIEPNKSVVAEFLVSVSPHARDGKAVFNITAEESQRDYKAQPIRNHIPVYHLDKPKIEWVYPRDYRIETEDNKINIRAIVKSESEIEEHKILVNGKVVYKNGESINTDFREETQVAQSTSRIRNNLIESTINAEIELRPLAECEITIYAKNASTGTTSEKRVIYYRIERKDLYVLSIGISEYKNPIRRLKFAAKDAKAISNVFKTQNSKIFKNVYTKELYNSEATQLNILNALEWLKSKSRHNDVSLIFIAAHGQVDSKGRFYILPSDGILRDISRGVTQTHIKKSLSEIHGTRILLLDACHSGVIANLESLARGDIVNQAIELIAESEDDVITFMATSGIGEALESPEWGHGAFTHALIAGLQKGRADYENNGVVYLPQLYAFVTKYVHELTHGQQKPRMFNPTLLPIFQWK